VRCPTDIKQDTHGVTSDDNLVCAVSIANPLDLNMTSLHIGTTFMGRYFDKYLGALLGKIIIRATKRFSFLQVSKNDDQSRESCTTVDLSLTSKSRSVREFDDRCTTKMFGYSSVEEYYDLNSSAGFLNDVSIPLLLFQSVDDPISCFDAADLFSVKLNPNLCWAVTHTGGHGCYFSGLIPRRWLPPVVMEFVSSALNPAALLSTVLSEGRMEN